jgi:hypothetical protein
MRDLNESPMFLLPFMSKEIGEKGSTFERLKRAEIPLIVFLNNPLNMELHSSGS